jgi:hypothetical protein
VPSLEEQLHERFLEDYLKAKSIGYAPTRFIQMMNERGALATAKALLAGGPNDVPEGFTTLYLLKRLDLSIEAIALDPKFTSLFTADEVLTAKERLKKVGYPD